MALLSDADRAAVHAETMSALSREREACGLTKPELREAVNAADAWVSANATDYNSALPLIARTTLTAPQKARLLAYVILRRYQTGA